MIKIAVIYFAKYANHEISCLLKIVDKKKFHTNVP